MNCLTLKPNQSFFVYCIQSKERFFLENKLFKENSVEDWTKIQKEGFLTVLALSVLENKTNATSHPNIGSLKTAIEVEWNSK